MKLKFNYDLCETDLVLIFFCQIIKELVSFVIEQQSAKKLKEFSKKKSQHFIDIKIHKNVFSDLKLL